MSTCSTARSFQWENATGAACKTAIERVSNGRILLETISSVIADIERLEKQHAANLRKLASRLEVPATESDTVRGAVVAFRNDLQSRARHAVEFAMSLRSDVLEPTLLMTVANHESVLTQIKTDERSSTDVASRMASAFEKSVIRTDATLRRALYHTLIAQRCEFGLPQVRRKMSLQALESALEGEIREREYELVAKRWEVERSVHSGRVKSMLRALESMDRKRIECLRDSLSKVLIHRTSQTKNIEYDSKSVIEAVQAINSDKDLEDWTSCNLEIPQSAEPPPPCTPLQWPELADLAAKLSTPTTAEPKSQRPQTVRDLLKHTTLDSVVQTAQAQLKELTRSGSLDAVEVDTALPLERLLNDETMADPADSLASVSKDLLSAYDSALTLLWRGSPEDLQELQEKGGLQQDFGGSFNRDVFARVLARRAHSGPFRLGSMQGYYALCHLCCKLLDKADEQDDFSAPRTIMATSLNFFAIGAGEADPQTRALSWTIETRESYPEYDGVLPEVVETLPDGATIAKMTPPYTGPCLWRLNRGLYHHAIWNRVQFWDDSLKMTLSEDRQHQMLLRAWRAWARMKGIDSDSFVDKQEKGFKDRNPCWPSLCVFAFCMLSFGIKAEQIAEMIRQNCAAYQLPSEFCQQLTECLRRHSGDEKSQTTSSDAGDKTDDIPRSTASRSAKPSKSAVDARPKTTDSTRTDAPETTRSAKRAHSNERKHSHSRRLSGGASQIKGEPTPSSKRQGSQERSAGVRGFAHDRKPSPRRGEGDVSQSRQLAESVTTPSVVEDPSPIPLAAEKD